MSVNISIPKNKKVIYTGNNPGHRGRTFRIVGKSKVSKYEIVVRPEYAHKEAICYSFNLSDLFPVEEISLLKEIKSKMKDIQEYIMKI
jgi:hypothetical protein